MNRLSTCQDITDYMDERKMTAEAVVEDFRAACVAETGLTVSAGYVELASVSHVDIASSDD